MKVTMPETAPARPGPGAASAKRFARLSAGAAIAVLATLMLSQTAAAQPGQFGQDRGSYAAPQNQQYGSSGNQSENVPQVIPEVQQDSRRQSSGLQVPQRIVALVNDEPISAYDVMQRLRLTIASIGGIDSQQQLSRLQEQVVRNMVDEKLKLQEAREFDVEISDQDLQRAFAEQARNFNQTPQQFENYLNRLGVDKETFLQQMRTEIAWGELVNGRLRRMAKVAQEEVEQELARIKSNAGEPEYRLSEIYLLVSNPGQSDRVAQRAKRIRKQLRDGANFEGYAQQFSQSSTAASGGDMGWVTADQLTPELAKAVRALEPGGISKPLRTAGGYHILKLKDRRRVLGTDPLDAKLQVKQIFMPNENLDGNDGQTAFMDRYKQMRPAMNSCSDIDNYATKLGAPTTSDLGTVRLREMPKELRPKLKGLELGKPTSPTRMEDGYRIFFVCKRNLPKADMPTFDEVIQRLERQKLAMMARRYLRDLRRNAVVDYRTTEASAQQVQQ